MVLIKRNLITDIPIAFRKKFISWFKKDPIYNSLLILILFWGIFFRTYNYTDRVFIQADNARDVQVARYAADNLKVPLTGQFSSAGPFFYGPWYYWFLEVISFIPRLIHKRSAAL